MEFMSLPIEIFRHEVVSKLDDLSTAMLPFLSKEFSQNAQPRAPFFETIYEACKTGNLLYLKYFYPGRARPRFPQCARMASFGGHVSVLEWLFEELSFPDDASSLLDHAIFSEKVDAYQWLLSKGAKPSELTLVFAKDRPAAFSLPSPTIGQGQPVYELFSGSPGTIDVIEIDLPLFASDPHLSRVFLGSPYLAVIESLNFYSYIFFSEKVLEWYAAAKLWQLVKLILSDALEITGDPSDSFHIPYDKLSKLVAKTVSRKGIGAISNRAEQPIVSVSAARNDGLSQEEFRWHFYESRETLPPVRMDIVTWSVRHSFINFKYLDFEALFSEGNKAIVDYFFQNVFLHDKSITFDFLGMMGSLARSASDDYILWFDRQGYLGRIDLRIHLIKQHLSIDQITDDIILILIEANAFDLVSELVPSRFPKLGVKPHHQELIPRKASSSRSDEAMMKTLKYVIGCDYICLNENSETNCVDSVTVAKILPHWPLSFILWLLEEKKLEWKPEYTDSISTLLTWNKGGTPENLVFLSKLIFDHNIHVDNGLREILLDWGEPGVDLAVRTYKTHGDFTNFDIFGSILLAESPKLFIQKLIDSDIFHPKDAYESLTTDEKDSVANVICFRKDALFEDFESLGVAFSPGSHARRIFYREANALGFKFDETTYYHLGRMWRAEFPQVSSMFDPVQEKILISFLSLLAFFMKHPEFIEVADYFERAVSHVGLIWKTFKFARMGSKIAFAEWGDDDLVDEKFWFTYDPILEPFFDKVVSAARDGREGKGEGEGA